MRKRFKNNDPFMMQAKFSCSCPDCKKAIKKGDIIIYVPLSRKAYCEQCGEPVMRSLQAEKSMDNFGTDIY